MESKKQEEAQDMQKALHELQAGVSQTLNYIAAINNKLAAVNAPTWVPPGHFYSPICNPVEVNARKNTIFDRTVTPAMIDMREKEQLDFFRRVSEHYGRFSFAEKKQSDVRFFLENSYFSYGDALMLACILLELKPKNLLEFGTGFSSCITLDINELFLKNSMNCTFVDPFPKVLQSLLKPEDEGKVSIVRSMAQDVDLALVDALGDGDVLFIDSTHVTKAGGDVNFHLFTILPRLASGVYIHFHDILFPFEYPQEWLLKENRSWNEAYILRAFLMGNPNFEIVFFNDYMYERHHEEMNKRMPLFSKGPGGSLWLRKR